MFDDPNWNMPAPGGSHPAGRREREQSGIEPVVRWSYRRRGRSISRVVSIPQQVRDEQTPDPLEIFFGLG
jgi:hypothetical protein